MAVRDKKVVSLINSPSLLCGGWLVGWMDWGLAGRRQVVGRASTHSTLANTTTLYLICNKAGGRATCVCSRRAVCVGGCASLCSLLFVVISSAKRLFCAHALLLDTHAGQPASRQCPLARGACYLYTVTHMPHKRYPIRQSGRESSGQDSRSNLFARTTAPPSLRKPGSAGRSIIRQPVL